MNEVDRRLWDLAERQHGVLSRRQARDLGLSSSAISHRVRCGALIECGTAVLRPPGIDLSWPGQLTIGLLDLGRPALTTGRSSAQLLGLDGFEGDALEFLVPRSRRNRTTIGTVTSTREIAPLDRASVNGIRCTSATRTVIELLRHGSLDEAGDALDSACRMRMTTVPVLRRRLTELGHRREAARFEQLIAMGVVESWLERRFLEVVRIHGLPEPTLQRRHQLDGVGTVRVDFEYPLWGIVIEVGGRRGYMTRDERQRKERRRNALQVDGKTVYFFTRSDIVDHPDYVASTVAAALGLNGDKPGPVT